MIEEHPGEQAGEDYEEDELRTGRLDNGVEPAVEAPMLGLGVERHVLLDLSDGDCLFDIVRPESGHRVHVGLVSCRYLLGGRGGCDLGLCAGAR